MKILFIGDVQGVANVNKLRRVVTGLRDSEGVSFVIANGENSADSNGITPASAKLMFSHGVDVITTGNHAFKRREMDSMFDERGEVLRPANFGDACPGKGFTFIDFGYCELCVVNIMGTVFMPPCDNPFKCMDGLLEQIKTPNIVVDFHAEATAEKRAMAEYLCGRVSAVLGTHTHVQTADEQILGGHTAFISDVGMVGAVDSIIGADKSAVKLFTDYYPQRFVYPEGESVFSAVIIELDTLTGRAVSVKRLYKNI
jgi:hypothetical protein